MSMTFKLVAYTDAAGKYTPGAYLNGNEDNFYTDADISGNGQKTTFGQLATLSPEGMVMAVADGMGGQNAGEVASAIAIETVKEYFSHGRVTADMASSHDKRKAYLESIVVEADKRIKQHAKQHAGEKGMGSTLIIAWIACGELTLTWIGDSRAYLFNATTGLQPLSKDHSYVQSLVDKGVITYEQTFDHPQGNIILRSLGDTAQKAQPETRLFTVGDGDVVLLCSDGLSGVLRDRKTYENGVLLEGENIEDIIAANADDIVKCKDELFAAAERADWYDNVTAILCRICSGGSDKPKLAESILSEGAGGSGAEEKAQEQGNVAPAQEQPAKATGVASRSLHIHISSKGVTVLVVGIVLVIAALAVACVLLFTGRKGQATTQPAVAPAAVDTTRSCGNNTTNTVNGDSVHSVEKSSHTKTEQKGSDKKTLDLPNIKSATSVKGKTEDTAEKPKADTDNAKNAIKGSKPAADKVKSASSVKTEKPSNVKKKDDGKTNKAQAGKSKNNELTPIPDSKSN